MAAAQPANPPPRPAEWEVPDLKDESKYFVTQIYHLFDISSRLLASLTSWPGPPSYRLRISNERDRSRIDLERFLREGIDFQNQLDWEPHRLLGVGGYGKAGLWIRPDQNGRAIDELVVKDQKDSDLHDLAQLRYTEPGGVQYRGLLKEAVIQKQLNQSKCENLVHLRGYAFLTPRPPVVLEDDLDRREIAVANKFPKVKKRKRANDAGAIPQVPRPPIPNDEAGRYRLYMEYAPHSTLEDLINLYRAWDTLLPEAFLWHVFDSLAAALQVQAAKPIKKFSSKGWTRNSVKYWPADYEVVHFDIKTNNILLGYKEWKDDRTDVTGGSAILGYPIIKLADFGLADITGRSDPDNVRRNHWKATPGFKPPEAVWWGWDWAQPPNNRPRGTGAQGGLMGIEEFVERELTTPTTFYGSAHSVWAIGKIMYDLMSLSMSSDFGELHTRCNTEARYHLNNRHFMHPTRWNWEPWYHAMSAGTNMPHLQQAAPYSQDLIDLVFACLKPEILLRIKLNNLRPKTQAFLARAEAQASPNQPNPRPRKKPRRRANRGPPLAPATAVTRLYYRDNHVTRIPAGMPPGNRTYVYRPGEYEVLHHRKYADADWPQLALPPKFQGNDKVDVVQIGYPIPPYPHNYNVQGNDIDFRPPPNPANAVPRWINPYLAAPPAPAPAPPAPAPPAPPAPAPAPAAGAGANGGNP